MSKNQSSTRSSRNSSQQGSRSTEERAIQHSDFSKGRAEGRVTTSQTTGNPPPKKIIGD